MTGSNRHQGTSYATDDMLGWVCKNYVSDFVECFSDAYREGQDHFVRIVRSGRRPGRMELTLPPPSWPGPPTVPTGRKGPSG